MEYCLAIEAVRELKMGEIAVICLIFSTICLLCGYLCLESFTCSSILELDITHFPIWPHRSLSHISSPLRHFVLLLGVFFIVYRRTVSSSLSLLSPPLLVFGPHMPSRYVQPSRLPSQLHHGCCCISSHSQNHQRSVWAHSAK